MNEEPLPMGKVINCHLGTFEFPYDVLELAMFDDHLIVKCKEADFKVYKDDQGRIHLEEIEYRG